MIQASEQATLSGSTMLSDPPYLHNNSEIRIHKPQTNTKISKIKRNEITENKNKQKVTNETIFTVEKITTEDPTVAAVISLPEPTQPRTNTDIISLIAETDVKCHPETAQYAGETSTQDDLGARAEGPEESSHILQAIHRTTDPEDQQIHRTLRGFLNSLKSHGKKSSIRNNCLIVDDRKFTVEDLTAQPDLLQSLIGEVRKAKNPSTIYGPQHTKRITRAAKLN
ncbi:hypothetical protein JTB14_018463 [Gonioctena quinquepunctata]|nr:hypothetical protein JTB14_018463 [Gonioctena quinquepunctata]